MTIIEHVVLAISRLMEQRKTAENLQALITSSCNQAQEVEQVLQQLLEQRGLDYATGESLNIIGEIVGQTRGGREDLAYRTRIRLRISQNNSEGTVEQMLGIMRGLLAPYKIEFTEIFPAEFSILIMVPTIDVTDEEVLEAVQNAKPAGVGSGYIARGQFPAFAFAGDADPDKEGFALDAPDLAVYYDAWQALIISHGPGHPLTVQAEFEYETAAEQGGKFVTLY